LPQSWQPGDHCAGAPDLRSEKRGDFSARPSRQRLDHPVSFLEVAEVEGRVEGHRKSHPDRLVCDTDASADRLVDRAAAFGYNLL
jgi:hypothetical protein